jgi:hypothetical protein
VQSVDFSMEIIGNKDADADADDVSTTNRTVREAPHPRHIFVTSRAKCGASKHSTVGGVDKSENRRQDPSARHSLPLQLDVGGAREQQSRMSRVRRSQGGIDVTHRACTQPRVRRTWRQRSAEACALLRVRLEIMKTRLCLGNSGDIQNHRESSIE